MLSPLETGTTLGRPRERGRSRETGPSHGCLAPAGGARRQQARQLAGPGAARLGKAPHLIHGGPCLILPGRNVFLQDRHAGNRRNASRDDPGHRREHRRGPYAAAPRPEAVGTEAAVAGPDQRASIRGPGSCTISSAPGPEPRLRPPGCVTARTARCSAAACRHGKRAAYLLAVHKDVDDLCATALSLCICGGNAGDSAAWPHPKSAFYLGKAPAAPVHAEKPGNCPHAASQ